MPLDARVRFCYTRAQLMSAQTKDANTRCQIYLVNTAYAGTSSTDFTTNLQRWLKDGSQAGASTMSATQRWMKLLANAAGL